MVSRFYRAYSKHLLWAMLLSLPLLYKLAYAAKSNNDIETWLPQETAVRQNYEKFKRDFGVEEAVLVGVSPEHIDEALVESVAQRLDALPGVRDCITPARLMKRMRDCGVPADEARQRITGLLVGPDDRLEAIVVGLDATGTKNRGATVAEIRRALDYCLLERPEIALTGSPVLITELDRLGSPEASTAFFGITLLICLGLLKYSIGDWKLSLALLGVTIWTICLTKALVLACGGEMNFIMGALSMMVMIFTLSIAVHYIDYHSEARVRGVEDPLWYAMKESMSPSVLSTLTTLLGLISLNVSSILPVRQFGYAAALGAIVAMVIGLAVTPALVTVWPNRAAAAERRWFDFAAWGAWVGQRRRPLLWAAGTLTVILGFGLTRLVPHIDPVDFLPKTNDVAMDLRRVDRELTSIGSVEAIVDCGLTERPFIEKLLEVRRIQERINAHPAVRHSFSVASLFPTVMPDSPLAAAKLYSTAMQQGGGGNYLAQDQRLWRISIRVQSGWKADRAVDALTGLLATEPVTLTGVAPLIADAQNEIFTGYWQSLTAALITISIVMVIALRSIKTGLIAMVPNILPIWFVFGTVGYLGMPVDIGMMMTGSIAIGISVDCTFHYFVKYRESVKAGRSSIDASCDALAHTGKPLMESTVVSSIGMLALCLSSFTPTSRFGWLMAALMTTSLIGELIMLPALLSLGGAKTAKTLPAGERAGMRLEAPHAPAAAHIGHRPAAVRGRRAASL